MSAFSFSSAIARVRRVCEEGTYETTRHYIKPRDGRKMVKSEAKNHGQKMEGSWIEEDRRDEIPVCRGPYMGGGVR